MGNMYEAPAIPKYKKWDNEDQRPTLAGVGDLVRVGRRKGYIVRWDEEPEDGDIVTIAFGFDLEDHPSDKMTFISRQKMWWEHLDATGHWAINMTAYFQCQKRDIAEALDMMRKIDREAQEIAAKHWTEQEIQEAKEKCHESTDVSRG